MYEWVNLIHIRTIGVRVYKNALCGHLIWAERGKGREGDQRIRTAKPMQIQREIQRNEGEQVRQNRRDRVNEKDELEQHYATWELKTRDRKQKRTG